MSLLLLFGGGGGGGGGATTDAIDQFVAEAILGTPTIATIDQVAVEYAVSPPNPEIIDQYIIEYIEGPAPEPPPPPPMTHEPPGDDFGAPCLELSTKLCNQALAHIGVTNRLLNVETDSGAEADQCRLWYSDAVNEALREHPWAWATKYAQLVYVAGTPTLPVNGDWDYSFELPDDCLYARRLVRKELGRTFDADPPAFRQGGPNTTHRLLFTNYRDPESDVESPEVELEYTYRPDCVAIQGDSLFRQAFTWMLASKLAPGLSRNKRTADDCWAMFLHTCNRASTVVVREQQQDQNGTGDPDWLRGR